MEAANVFYYTATVFLMVVMLMWIVVGILVFRVLRSAKKGVEEMKESMKSTQLLRKALAAGGMMIAGKVIAELKKKFEGGGKRE